MNINGEEVDENVSFKLNICYTKLGNNLKALEYGNKAAANLELFL